MNRRSAGVVVFGGSAAVLVVELAAIRLLAPYVGQSLDTFTAIVTTVLAGISFGTWWGGRVADRSSGPTRLVGIELLAGGALTIAIVPLTAVLGPAIVGDGPIAVTVVAAATLFAPSAAMSAVAPTVVRAVLSNLAETGTVVGRYSAIGTAGAILGSILTGFVLVPSFGTSTILVATGGIAALAGITLSIRRPTTVITAIVLLVAGGALAAVAGDRCDDETQYYCVRIVHDPTTASGRILVLDDLAHSYVDLADPTRLEFTYTRMLAAAVRAGTEGRLDVVFLGGGAYTLPTWLSSERPGSTSTVLELDPELPAIVGREMPPPDDIPTRLLVGDGRVSMRALATASADVVVGDAFGGRAVPWHLTTSEFVADIARVLRPGGLYLANIIDGPRLDFTKAMARTLHETFGYVTVFTLPARLETGGNLVIVAGDRPVDDDAIVSESAALGLTVTTISGADLDRFTANADVLTDDHAPVDQLVG